MIADQEVMDYINKYYQEIDCIQCVLWDFAAKNYGKRGMCAECFERDYVGVQWHVDSLDLALRRESKKKELEMRLRS